MIGKDRVRVADLRKSPLQIVKVQLSMVSSDGKQHVLIYDQDRRRVWEGRPDKWLFKRMAEQKKAYFNARWNNKAQCWEIGSQVPEQDW